MLIELGQELANAREKKALSLEAVAGPAKISGAYLHKLERGVVNNPSPRVLARIAVALDVPYLRLMELAGYLDEMQLAEAQMRESAPKPHPLAGQQLTSDEWKQVGAFIKKLVAARKPKAGKGSGSRAK
ncbi:MAG: helix-turn-helix domain-containing protein [Acidobacteriota bacterium]